MGSPGWLSPTLDLGWLSPDPPSPIPGSTLGAGWLSPSLGSVPPSAVFIEQHEQHPLWPDDGGEIVHLDSDWETIAGTGPYRVRLRHAALLTLYPDTTTGQPGCWGLVPSGGTDLTLDSITGRLVFNLPRVPPGIYDVIVYWGAFFAQSVVITNAITVTRRGRAQATWSIRSHLSRELRGAGPRSNTTQPRVGK